MSKTVEQCFEQFRQYVEYSNFQEIMLCKYMERANRLHRSIKMCGNEEALLAQTLLNELELVHFIMKFVINTSVCIVTGKIGRAHV